MCVLVCMYVSVRVHTHECMHVCVRANVCVHVSILKQHQATDIVV